MPRLLRPVILCLALGAVVFAGYLKLVRDDRAAAVRELEALNADMTARLDAHREMIERLGRNRRLAHVEIVDQRPAPDGSIQETDILFVELDERGRDIARQSFTIPGDVVFIDAWTVQFAPEDVARGHPLRGRTLILLRRVYSDLVAPAHGIPIDTPGAIPPAYAGSDAARYEQRIWTHFWDVATDAALADAMGVRVAQGVAVYKAVATGDRYRLTVDDAGGMSLVPVPAASARAGADPS
ncbi:MAG: hypothetical protein GY715_07410 [Planctomycetes bacterium]|nr:hypothetical protein [Planctomycetota bacterium]